jgi:hypothetical protein
MRQVDFDLSVSLLIALASGHWSTLDALIARIQPPDFPRGWLQTVYLVNVRDVLVTADLLARDPQMAKAALGTLIAHTVLGASLMPSAEIEGHSVIQLAHCRVILNTITASPTKFNALVPRLSLLDIRAWCLDNVDDSLLAQAMLGVLQSAGNDPSNPEAAAEGPGIAFENMLAYFLVVKFLVWRDYDHATVSRTLALPLHKAGASLPTTSLQKGAVPGSNPQPLFPGHVVMYGEPPLVLLHPAATPCVRHVREKGGFRAGKPPSMAKITPKQWENQMVLWRKRCLETTLDFGETSEALGAQCIIQPGAKNQPHSDALAIVGVKKARKEDGGNAPEVKEEQQDGGNNPEVKEEKQTLGEIFVQNKFSCGTASTKLVVSDVNNAVDKLLLERGVLFFETEEEAAKQRGRATNQISRLGILEENVVLCFSVLRTLSPSLAEFAKSVHQHATTKSFKGAIVVSNGQTGGMLLYGDSFKQLALVHSSTRN